MPKQPLHELLRRARLRGGFTQQHVADAVHVSREAYVKMENGTRGISSGLIMPLCETLGVSAMEALSAVSDYDTEPQNVHVAGRGCDAMAWFSDNGVTYLFEPDEWVLHCEMARFAGLDPMAPDALELSHDVIFLHRSASARDLLEKYFKKDGERNEHEP